MGKTDTRDFFGIVISKDLLANNELNITEKVIYAYIASYKDCCYESNKVIAEKIGISSSSVSHGISKLVKREMVYIVRINGNDSRRRIYAVYDKPGRLAFLKEKYGEDGCGKLVEKPEGGLQNLLTCLQNLQTSKTGVRLAKFANIEYRIKKNKAESEKNRGADNPPKALDVAFGGLGRLRRGTKDYEEEFYRRNTFKLAGAGKKIN